MDRLVEGITGLNLRNNTIKNLNNLKSVCKFIKKTKTLKYLSLHNNSIGDKGCIYLANAIKLNKSIIVLYLSINSIGDKGCKYLANSLKFNNSIHTLYLFENLIEHEGCKFLADALKINKSLQKLDIHYNYIGNIGLRYLADTLKYNSSLRYLDLDLGINIVPEYDYFWHKFNYSNNKIQELWIGGKLSELTFFHKYLIYFVEDNIIKRQKWFIQNYQYRFSDKLWLLLFIKN